MSEKDYPIMVMKSHFDELTAEFARLKSEIEMLKGALEAGEQEKNAMEVELAALRITRER